MIAFIKKQKSLLAGEPTPIVIDGHQGQSIDLSLSPTWNKGCPDENGVMWRPSSVRLETRMAGIGG